MDSEWNKTSAPLLFSLGKLHKVVEACNLDPDVIHINKDRIFLVAKVKNTVQVGSDIVNQQRSWRKRLKNTRTIFLRLAYEKLKRKNIITRTTGIHH